MMREVVSIFLTITVFTIFLGFGYPFAVWAVARLAFPHTADGSLIEKDGAIVGSELIGQRFSGEHYFHSRPSAAGDGYDATASGGSNLGISSEILINRVRTAESDLRRQGLTGPVPADLVTASGSGLDPHISPDAARFQVPRVARFRGLSEEELLRLINEHVEPRQLGFLGEPRVNALRLNLALDSMGN